MNQAGLFLAGWGGVADTYNPAATLFFTTGDKTIEHLLSRNTHYQVGRPASPNPHDSLTTIHPHHPTLQHLTTIHPRHDRRTMASKTSVLGSRCFAGLPLRLSLLMRCLRPVLAVVQFDYGALFTLLIVYFSLCCYTAGMAPALGTMVPALLIGGPSTHTRTAYMPSHPHLPARPYQAPLACCPAGL